MGVKQRYQVIERIDAGGMAEIFKGRALSLDGIEKPVAIKRILPSLSQNKKFLKMFIDEARLSMRLNHANIVQVFDVGRADDTYFLVMEFVDGSNVRRLFQKAAEVGYQLPVAVAAHVTIEIAKGLSTAHEAADATGSPLGIVHRDVSPPNILISWSGEVKITDFGLAKAVSQLERTEPGVVKGKYSYLSPEAAEGRSVDARSDIFSAGIILHELLTGRRLFMGKTDLETVDLVKACQVPSPSSLRDEVPPELDAIVLKALAKDRRRRYQSAREIGDELANFLFSRGMKVTGFDVARTMREIFGRKDTLDGYEVRIQEMIREEVLSLSMMGLLESTSPAGRAAPIDIQAMDQSRSMLDDLWQDLSSQEGGSSGGTGSFAALTSDSGAGVAKAEPSAPSAAKPAPRRRRALLLALLALLLGLAGAGGWLAATGRLQALLSPLID
ncbi:MAG: serine/threonine protein kinase [Deltaproteobacteria bacterium]|nr:serine/threonine protein kinase [Deltaproteobacteria bacterium]